MNIFPEHLIPENYDAVSCRSQEGNRLALIGDSVLSLCARQKALKMSNLWTAGDIHTVSSEWVSNATIARVILDSNIWMAIGLPPLYMIRRVEGQHLELDVSERMVATGFEALVGNLFQNSPKQAYAIVEQFLEFASASALVTPDSGVTTEESLGPIPSAESTDDVGEMECHEDTIINNSDVPGTLSSEHEGVRSVFDTPCLVGCVEEVLPDESSDGPPYDGKLQDIIQGLVMDGQGDSDAEPDTSHDGITAALTASHIVPPESDVTPVGDEQFWPRVAEASHLAEQTGPSVAEASWLPELSENSAFGQLASTMLRSVASIEVLRDQIDPASETLTESE